MRSIKMYINTKAHTCVHIFKVLTILKKCKLLYRSTCEAVGRPRRSIAVRIVRAVMSGDAGRIPFAGAVVPKRFGRYLVRAVRIVGAVGGRQAGRVTGFIVRRGRLLVMMMAVWTRDVRMVLVPRAVMTGGRRAVVLTVVVAVVARVGAWLSVRGQQHVVAVRVIRTQGRVQAGRVPGAAG